MTASLTHRGPPYRSRRKPRDGLLLVLTDGPSAVPATAHSAALVASSGGRLHIAAVVPETGWTMNALLYQARNERTAVQSAAIAARVAPTLHAAVVRPTTIKPLFTDSRRDGRALPAARLKRLARRSRAGVIVAAQPLHRQSVSGPDPAQPAAANGTRR